MSTWSAWSRADRVPPPRLGAAHPGRRPAAETEGLDGERWSVSVSNQTGTPTLSEQKARAKTARFEAVAQEPMVRAVLDRFPGAEVVAVRQTVTEDVAAPMPDADE